MTTGPKADRGAGHGKPPAGARFQKGRSGNPRGRPRGKMGVTAQLLKALDAGIAVGESDHARGRSRRALGIARLADQFAAGDPQAVKLVLGLLLDLERRKAAEPAGRPPLDEHDREVIKNLRALYEDPGSS